MAVGGADGVAGRRDACSWACASSSSSSGRTVSRELSEAVLEAGGRKGRVLWPGESYILLTIRRVSGRAKRELPTGPFHIVKVQVLKVHPPPLAKPPLERL